MTEVVTCARCGARRTKLEMGMQTRADGSEEWLCHPSHSIGLTCYMLRQVSL